MKTEISPCLHSSSRFTDCTIVTDSKLWTFRAMNDVCEWPGEKSLSPLAGGVQWTIVQLVSLGQVVSFGVIEIIVIIGSDVSCYDGCFGEVGHGEFSISHVIFNRAMYSRFRPCGLFWVITSSATPLVHFTGRDGISLRISWACLQFSLLFCYLYCCLVALAN